LRLTADDGDLTAFDEVQITVNPAPNLPPSVDAGADQTVTLPAVNHDVLMSRLRRWIGDKRLLRIIRRFLEAGLLQQGVKISRVEGTPQGGPLSPLLANLLLDDLDKELERRGHRFCRYADDCNIYVQSKRAGERVMESITHFLESRLRLRVNREKSAVAHVQERKFLGYRLLREGHLGLAPASLERTKARIRQLTRRNRGVSITKVIGELNEYLKGWWRMSGTPQAHEAMPIQWFQEIGLISLTNRYLWLTR